MPALPDRKYSLLELGLEDVPPPLPPRNYSWSDVEDDGDEDNDDEVMMTSLIVSEDDRMYLYLSISIA